MGITIVTAREFTIDDLILEFKDTMFLNNRTFCPVVQKLELMKHVWTVSDFQDWIFAHEAYAIPYIIDVIAGAGTHHPPDVAANAQEAYAWQLTQYPWEKVRQPLELLLHSDVPGGIAPNAMHILLGIIRQNHPNAKAFLAQRPIAAKVPFYVDMTDWPCLDEERKAEPLSGKRNWDWDTNPKKKFWKQLTGPEAEPPV